jgi:hypothetical protein
VSLGYLKEEKIVFIDLDGNVWLVVKTIFRTHLHLEVYHKIGKLLRNRSPLIQHTQGFALAG